MWKDLSLNEKAELIKLAVNNGITDLSTIRDTYNKYAEGGPLDDSDTSKEVVNSNAIPSELPEAVVTGYAPLRLTTHYPIVSEKYPYTGHSELSVPIDPETFYGEYNPGRFNHMHYLHIDKKSNDSDYNFITNNCADATLNFLNNAFNKNETPNLFTTPGDVRDLAIKLGGRIVKNNDGSDTVLIPRNKDNYKDISKKALDLFYSDIKSFGLHGSHSYSEGGPIKKVGPTYDPEKKVWIGPNGQDITGKSFEGDWGITTYLDTGAVELDTRDDDPKERYKYRYADNAKRVYIGGKTNETRQEYFNRDKEFTEAVKASSKKHGISANLLASRIAKEGPVDEAIRNYNNTNGYFQRGSLIGPLWGLDDMGTMISEGIVKIDPNMVVNTDHEFQNEKGRTTYSVDSDNYLDGVELTAVALRYFKDEMRKRYPKVSEETLEQYANAAFNMGIPGATKAINEGRIINAYKPFINIKANGGPLWGNYNKYDKGGELEKEELLPEVVITPRTSALAASREATRPNTDFSYAQDMTSMQRWGANNLDNFLGRMIGIDPHTCLNTVTGFYNPKATVAANINFVAHPEDYGFKEEPQSEAQPGDLIILSNKNNHPNHAVMFDGIAERDGVHNGFPYQAGDTLVNYSNGGRNINDYRLQGPLIRFDDLNHSGGDFSGTRRYYKYVGKKNKR